MGANLVSIAGSITAVLALFVGFYLYRTNQPTESKGWGKVSQLIVPILSVSIAAVTIGRVSMIVATKTHLEGFTGPEIFVLSTIIVLGILLLGLAVYLPRHSTVSAAVLEEEGFELLDLPRLGRRGKNPNYLVEKFQTSPTRADPTAWQPLPHRRGRLIMKKEKYIKGKQVQEQLAQAC